MNTQRLPSMGTVARMQLKLLWQMKYALGLTMILAWGVLGMSFFSKGAEVLPPWMARPLLVPLHVTIVFLGGLGGVLAWMNEAPQNRRYHWSLPVQREVHDIMRIMAGAVWLIVALAVFAACAWLTEEPIIRDQWLAHAPFFWLSIFLTPLLAYLLTSIAALMTGRPLLWLGGIITIVTLTALEPIQQLVPKAVIDFRTALFSEKYPPSLGVALAGGYIAAPWHDGKEIYRVYNATKDGIFGKRPPSPQLREMLARDMERARTSRADVLPSEWLMSIGVWYMVALLGLAFALKRRPDV